MSDLFTVINTVNESFIKQRGSNEGFNINNKHEDLNDDGFNEIRKDISRVRHLKFLLKFALTHGAYSVKNKDKHLMKYGKNYNPKEKVLAESHYIYGAMVGEKVQERLTFFFEHNQDFILEIRMKYPQLYEDLMEVLNNGKNREVHDGSPGREEKT